MFHMHCFTGSSTWGVVMISVDVINSNAMRFYNKKLPSPYTPRTLAKATNLTIAMRMLHTRSDGKRSVIYQDPHR